MLKTFLSTRTASFLILFTAIGARIIQLVFFYNLGVDASYQALAAENWLNGNGISMAHVSSENLSQVIFLPQLNWPPGYSILFVPFYLLFGRNYIAAAITLDIIMALVLLFANRAVLRRLGGTTVQLNLLTVINGFFIYYFYFIQSSDAITIAFFSLLLHHALRLYQNEGRDKSSLAVIVILSLVCAFLKYLFVPIVFVIPVFLMAAGHFGRMRSLRKAGLVAFALLFLLIAGLLAYQLKISGRAGYISSPERGLFWHHLLDTYPFILTAFIKPDTLLLGRVAQSGDVLYRVLQVLNLLLLIYITVCFFQGMMKKKNFQFSIIHAFYVMAFMISVVIFSLLAILSIQVSKEEILPGNFWTYVQEPRYYGLIVVLFHLGVFVFYRHSLRHASKWARFLFYTFAVLLVVETARGGYLTFRRIKNAGKEEYSWQYENRFQQAVGRVVEESIKEFPKTPILITGSSYYYNHRFSLYSHIPILYDFGAVLKKDPFTTAPVVVTSVVEIKGSTTVRAYEPILGKKKGSFENFDIYVRYVEPR